MKKSRIIFVLALVLVCTFVLASCEGNNQQPPEPPQPATYSINYNVEDGKSNNPATISEDGEAIVLAPASRDGFIFLGWFSDEKLTKSISVIEPTITEDISVYPKWLKIYGNAKYNGGNTEGFETEFPSLYIEIEGGKKVKDKEKNLDCTVTLKNVTEKYAFENLEATIKGRGNSSWKLAKKPYKLKFTDKVDFLGNGAAKTWTLIANHSDPSLVRNYFAYTLAHATNTQQETSTIDFVDLYINGEYSGVYTLCEQVQTGKTRVNINEELGDLNTGYLIEMDGYATEEGDINWNYFKVGKKYYTVKAPDPEDEQFSAEYVAYIKKYLQDTFTAFKSMDYSKVQEYVDVETFADAYIVHELVKCVDVNFSSFYLNKDTDGKLCCGPLWDFDCSSGNYSLGENSKRYDYLWAANENPFYSALMKYDEFKALVAERMREYEPLFMEIIAKSKEAILADAPSFNRNFERWDILGKYIFLNPGSILKIKTWEGQVEFVTDFLLKSWDYMKECYPVAAQ